MTEIVGSAVGPSDAAEGPHAPDPINGGQPAADGAPATPGMALIVPQAGAAYDLRHNAGWLTSYPAAHEAVHAAGWLLAAAVATLRLVLRGGVWAAVRTPKAVGTVAGLVLDFGKLIAVVLAFWVVFQAIREPPRIIDP